MSPLSRLILVVSISLLGAGIVHAQLNIPLTSITLVYPGIEGVALTRNGTTQIDRPTPFLINGSIPGLNGVWFCLDPLQPIYYNGLGEPAGNSLVFDSSNPSNFDLWGPTAPGLTPARLQNLADLFQAYVPASLTSVVAGALQLAVWEIANEPAGNPFSLSGPGLLSAAPYNGNVNSAAMVTLAEAMLASLENTPTKNGGDVGAVQLLIDGTYRRDDTSGVVLVQDLVGFSPLLPIPEPTTYALGCGVTLVMIVIARRARRPLSAQGRAA